MTDVTSSERESENNGIWRDLQTAKRQNNDIWCDLQTVKCESNGLWCDLISYILPKNLVLKSFL